MSKRKLRSEGYIVNSGYISPTKRRKSVSNPSGSGIFSNYCGFGPSVPTLKPQHSTDNCCYFHDTSDDYLNRHYYISDYLKYLDTGKADSQFLQCLEKNKPSFLNNPREWLVNRASYRIFKFKESLPLGAVKHFRKPSSFTPRFNRRFTRSRSSSEDSLENFIDLLGNTRPSTKASLFSRKRKNLNGLFKEIAKKTRYSRKKTFQKAKLWTKISHAKKVSWNAKKNAWKPKKKKVRTQRSFF